MGEARQGGAGLLNFHLIFQKTWAEPGTPGKCSVFLTIVGNSLRYYNFLNN